MFTGAIPRVTAHQIVKIVDFSKFESVYVCCSGSFRLERAIRRANQKIKIYSNDVSALSVSIGSYLSTGEVSVEFIDRLDFLEKFLKGFKSSPLDRLAAVSLALDAGNFSGKSEHNRAHFENISTNVATFHKAALGKISNFLDGLSIDGFFAGDFKEHAKNGMKSTGSIVVGFPPTYKGGYERLYKFISSNLKIPEITYDTWDPENIGDWIKSMRHGNYCISSDRLIADDIKPVAAFSSVSKKQVYVYANSNKSSFIFESYKTAPFKYSIVNASLIKKESIVSVVQCTAQNINFLRSIYLAKNINFTNGAINFLVFIDGLLTGGIVISKDKSGSLDNLYLLSDFSVTRDGKMAKLVALIATSSTLLDVANKRYFMRADTITTSVFTDKPVSMKYRGAFKLHARKNGFLQYVSEVRNETPQEIFIAWWNKYVKK